MDGTAVILCEGNFANDNAKTAHGLVRYCARYDIVGVIDSTLAGRFVDQVLEGAKAGIPIVASLDDVGADWLIVGVATQGGRLPQEFRPYIVAALRRGMHVACGLHDYLAEDPELRTLAEEHGCRLVDVRRPPTELHFFNGKIGEVDSLVIAVLGTEACIGKRTTTILLAEALNAAGMATTWVGTGQTAWLQGAKYGLRLDALINDFVAGEIEHAVYEAWHEEHPRVILVEGQGSLTHPAYPGGFEVLAAARPGAVVLQHAPGRAEYKGFPGFPVAPPETHIEIIRLMCGAPVLGVTISSEKLDAEAEAAARVGLEERLALPVCNPLHDGLDRIVEVVRGRLDERRAG